MIEVCPKRFRTAALFIVFIGIAYFPLFSHLGDLPIRLWDESRLANNALEMASGGDPVVTTYDGKPDMWNTKPPLFIWVQVVCLKILGYNELALRIPSALSALATGLILIWFSRRILGSAALGLIAALVLLTSNGYVHEHVTRTGDYDALVILWMSLYSLTYFAFLRSDNDRDKTRYLTITAAALSLAVLTKGVVGLSFMPALGIYTVITGRLPALLKSRRFYLNLGGVAFLVLGYYLLRESRNAGFLDAVYENEIGGRYLSTIEKHKEEFMFYYYRLRDFRFAPWLFFLPLGFAVGVVRSSAHRSFAVYSTLILLSFWLIISGGKTKLEWYDAPLLPVASLLVAVGIHYMAKVLVVVLAARLYLRTYAVVLCLMFAVFFQPYKSILDKVSNQQERQRDKERYGVSYILKKAIDERRFDSDYTVAYEGYDAHITFYIKVLDFHGASIQTKKSNEIVPGDVVIASQESVKRAIEGSYVSEVIEEYKEGVVYSITALRHQEDDADSGS